MKKMVRVLLGLIILFFEVQVFADKYDGTMDVFESAPELQPYFDNAFAYAVFPTVGKLGIVIGGAHGEGQVYEGDRIVGTVSLTKASIGFQLGGQVFSEIVFMQDKRAYKEFTSGRFEFDASASATLLTYGAQARAGRDGASASAGAGRRRGAQALCAGAVPRRCAQARWARRCAFKTFAPAVNFWRLRN